MIKLFITIVIILYQYIVRKRLSDILILTVILTTNWSNERLKAFKTVQSIRKKDKFKKHMSKKSLKYVM